MLDFVGPKTIFISSLLSFGNAVWLSIAESEFIKKYPNSSTYTKWRALEEIGEYELQRVCVKSSGNMNPAVSVDAQVIRHYNQTVKFYSTETRERMIRLDLLQCKVVFLNSSQKMGKVRTFFLAEGRRDGESYKLVQLRNTFHFVGKVRFNLNSHRLNLIVSNYSQYVQKPPTTGITHDWFASTPPLPLESSQLQPVSHQLQIKEPYVWNPEAAKFELNKRPNFSPQEHQLDTAINTQGPSVPDNTLDWISLAPLQPIESSQLQPISHQKVVEEPYYTWSSVATGFELNPLEQNHSPNFSPQDHLNTQKPHSHGGVTRDWLSPTPLQPQLQSSSHQAQIEWNQTVAEFESDHPGQNHLQNFSHHHLNTLTNVQQPHSYESTLSSVPLQPVSDSHGQIEEPYIIPDLKFNLPGQDQLPYCLTTSTYGHEPPISDFKIDPPSPLPLQRANSPLLKIGVEEPYMRGSAATENWPNNYHGLKRMDFDTSTNLHHIPLAPVITVDSSSESDLAPPQNHLDGVYDQTTSVPEDTAPANAKEPILGAVVDLIPTVESQSTKLSQSKPFPKKSHKHEYLRVRRPTRKYAKPGTSQEFVY